MLDLPETSSARRQVAASKDIQEAQINHWTRKYLEWFICRAKLDASKSLAVYCEPVELYNKIRSRPIFLERCLDHNIKNKHKKRILMTVTLSLKVHETQSLFPLCVCLGRLDPNREATGEEKYHVGRIFTFQGPCGTDLHGNHSVLVKFMLPQQEKLAVETNYDKYFLCILASAKNPISLSKLNESTMPVEVASNESLGGERSLLGKVSLKFLYEILKMSSDCPLQGRTEIQFSTEFRACNLKYCLQQYSRTKNRTISIRSSDDSEVEGKLKNVQISTRFEEFGAAREPPPCRRRKRNEEASSSSSLPHIDWLLGNVLFHYRYYQDKLKKTEVTENFTCAICLVQCVNYQGLKHHLIASHELFSFEFSESEEFPTVSLSVKNPNWKQQLIDPKLDTFMHCAKKPKRRKLNPSRHAKIFARNYADELSLDVELDINGDPKLLENVGCVPLISVQDGTNGVLEVSREEVSNAIILHTGRDCVPSTSNQDGTRGVLEVNDEEVSNAIVLHTNRDCVPSISHQDGTCGVLEFCILGRDCVPPISHQDGTCGVLEVDHEKVSNAIILHNVQDCVPLISTQDGTNGVLEVDQDKVSNAIVLHTNRDCVPDCVPPIFDHDNGTRAALEDDVSNAIILHPGLDSSSSIAMEEGGTSSMPQVEEKEKSLIELFDPNLIARWKKRTFYHSHTYQAMALEEVVKDEDSEDEINEGAREIEDKRKLELLGISGDQKRLQTMWDSFVKKHRVLADGHVNWAFEAFTKYHCAELAESTSLAW
ncbi:hypothetical protein ACSQ67_014549 [Phaseolus vulgaris]